MTKTLQAIVRGFLVLALLLSITSPIVFAQEYTTTTPAPAVEYFAVETVILDDGRSIDTTWINGPPTPPTGYERTTVELPKPNAVEDFVTLSVPAYKWSFGCSATSAAMIAAFYDRASYPAMYLGPTNGGVMPMDNTAWGTVSWNGETRWQCPLSATRNGLDGHTARGNVDDYYINYNHPGPDTYVTNGWAEHALADCTGDFMKTNRANSGNVDGGTRFWYWTNGTPMTAGNLEGLVGHLSRP